MTVLKNKKFKNEINLLNVLLCVLVVFIHVSSEAITTLDKTQATYLLVFIPWRLSGFVVPGFIVLSGIKSFLNAGETVAYKRFYLSRLKTVILPYILWVIIYYWYLCVLHQTPFQISELWRYIYIGDIAGQFYFIIIIAQFYALMPVWVKLFRKTSPILVIPFSLLINIIFGVLLPNIVDLFIPDYFYIYADRMFTMYIVYWVVGCYIGIYYDRFKEILKCNVKFIVGMFVFATAVYLFFSYYHFIKGKTLIWIDYVNVLYSLSMILTCYTVAIKVSDRKFAKNRFMTYMNKASYHIYLVHCLVIFYINDYLLADIYMTDKVRYLVRFFLVYIISIGSCVIYQKIKEQFKSRANIKR